MSPTFFGAGQLRGSELRIVDEDIGAGREFAQVFLQRGIAGLVVCGVDDGARGRFDAEAEATLRVIQWRAVTLFSPTRKTSPPSSSRNLRLALMAEKSTGK